MTGGGEPSEAASLTERSPGDGGTEADGIAFEQARPTDAELAAQARSTPFRRAVRWIGLLALGAMTALALLISVGTMAGMKAHDDCPRPVLQFEVVDTDTVAVAWFPPRVQCHYVVETLPERADRTLNGRPVYDDTVWESRWRVFLPIPFAVAWVALARSAHRRNDQR